MINPNLGDPFQKWGGWGYGGGKRAGKFKPPGGAASCCRRQGLVVPFVRDFCPNPVPLNLAGGRFRTHANHFAPFYMDKTMMVFGDAKKVVEDMVKAVE